jgi:predicted nucleotidyltransferase
MIWDQFVDICRRLNDARVNYVLVGGMAVVLHGYERTTRDIDLLVDVASDNIARIREALHEVLPEACGELRDNDVEAYAVIRMGGDEIILDLMKNIGDIDYTTAASSAEQVSLTADVTVSVASLNTMIELKRGLRGKDQDDLIFLEGKKRTLSEKS